MLIEKGTFPTTATFPTDRLLSVARSRFTTLEKSRYSVRSRGHFGRPLLCLFAMGIPILSKASHAEPQTLTASLTAISWYESPLLPSKIHLPTLFEDARTTGALPARTPSSFFFHPNFSSTHGRKGGKRPVFFFLATAASTSWIPFGWMQRIFDCRRSQRPTP